MNICDRDTGLHDFMNISNLISFILSANRILAILTIVYRWY